VDHSIAEQEPPLLELFNRLRNWGLPLGIDEYKLLLYALQEGFGLPDRAALARLCKTLWVKSLEEERLFDYHFEQVMHNPTSSQKSAPALPAAAAGSELAARTEDEIRVAQAILQASSTEEFFFNRYITSDEYFPVTCRQIKQSWRHLRRPIREGPPVELNVEATVKEIGRKGMLLEPVLEPRRTNHAELLLLIDQGGSMTPFHLLSRRLQETIFRGGHLEKVGIYYFHNCPTEYLYHDPAHNEFERIEEVLNSRYSQQAGVLVFSDAGAARGGINNERIELTKIFLDLFKRRFRYIAWLNPLPHSRWTGTTAGVVKQSVPMFDLSRRGLDNAISVLRGRLSPFT
jgi:uncharacterized protein with von Willebrand factor type A (vWA) domain